MNQLFLESMRGQSDYIHLLQNYEKQVRSKHPHPMLVTGLGENAADVFLPAVVQDLYDRCRGSILLIVPDEKEVLKLSGVLSTYDISVQSFPFRDPILHKVTASREYEQQRLGVLFQICSGAVQVVLTTPDALMQYTMPRDVLLSRTMTLQYGQSYDLQALLDFLTRAGYHRCEMVDGKGQFSLRGGILDIFPVQNDNPVRLEFFGDEIDQMGIFDPVTQRKIEQITACTITPAREILPDDVQTNVILHLITQLQKKASDPQLQKRLEEEADALRENTDFPADKYIAAAYATPQTLLDYFTNEMQTHAVIICDTDACLQRLDAFDARTQQTAKDLLSAGEINGKYAHFAKNKTDFLLFADNIPGIFINTFSAGEGFNLSGVFAMQAKQTVSYADQYPLLLEDVQHYMAQQYRIVVLAPNTAAQTSLQTLFTENHLPTVTKEPHSLMELPTAVTLILSGVQTDGYALPETRFVVLSTYPTQSAYARALKMQNRLRKKKRTAAEKIASYSDLNVGDYVVHEAHGVGQYLGIQSLTASDGTTRDYIKIRYAGTDELFIPCDQLDRISKYIGPRGGGDEGGVKLSKMGGAEWKRAKSRARAATKEMAHELIQLYAKRARTPGFAFAKDDAMQRDFESTFEYEETEAQLQAAKEIKTDMEKPTPMDRLLCGDVGYGKTEVALRAAFKAVLSGKQVAILAPTTLLALQHYQTMLTRMRTFPVRVELLSRMRSASQQQQIIRCLGRGEIDIVVGTHRLVSKDVVFRDLGLVIIDEEQRFGVRQKEKLKTFSQNVDVLTLTATPIPRTLHMAMSGIRDMSVLDEAPGDRVPVQTYVMGYEEGILIEAVRAEVRRGGQVFWLHNRVEDMEQVGIILHAALPELNIAYAHGQMDKNDLNRIWQQMINGQIDVLVTTTIIETGVDIPNANTLIVENAHKMGLSQLHQLRGRVGRSGRRAYAYLTYPRGIVLDEIQRKRLDALRDFTQFGAGFKIAMRDLEIRGAGNLLGAQQHGHMNDVGYDLYVKLLNEAILEEKGTPVVQKKECVIDLSVDAILPKTYIRSPAQRIDIYKKIAAVENRADYNDLYDELCDRFGTPPGEVENLLGISYLRALAQATDIVRIRGGNGQVLIYPDNFDFAAWYALSEQYRTKKEKVRIHVTAGKTPCLTCRIPTGNVLQILCNMLETLQTIKTNVAKEEQTNVPQQTDQSEKTM